MFDYFASPIIVLHYNLAQNGVYELSQSQLRSEIARKISFGNIRVTELNTGDISLALENKATRRVPIIPSDSLSFAAGYHLLQPLQIDPDSVTLTGPASALEGITMWKTDTLLLTNLKSSVKKKITLSDPPEGIYLSTNEVEVSIRVEQFTEKALFVPLLVRNAPDSLKYFPKTVKVTCVVGLSDYNHITVGDFSAEIDLAKVSLGEGKNTVPITMTRQSASAIHVQFTPKSAEFFILKRK